MYPLVPPASMYPFVLLKRLPKVRNTSFPPPPLCPIGSAAPGCTRRVRDIVDSILPVSHVDSNLFKLLVNRLTLDNFKPRCRQVVADQLGERFRCKKEELKLKLSQVQSVCTTADFWTSRRRSFLGLTVHLIEPNLQWKAACIAVRHVKESHTYDVFIRAVD